MGPVPRGGQGARGDDGRDRISARRPCEKQSDGSYISAPVTRHLTITRPHCTPSAGVQLGGADLATRASSGNPNRPDRESRSPKEAGRGTRCPRPKLRANPAL